MVDLCIIWMCACSNDEPMYERWSRPPWQTWSMMR
jgi:hypothetical protein